MLLRVKEIKTFYGKLEAVKGVSLEVAEGEIVTLLGANGAGKTTVLKAISGLKLPTAGEIWFSGQRIDKSQATQIVRMGISHILEGQRVFRDMTVESNLTLGAFVRSDGERIKADLEEVYRHFPILQERRKQKAGSLSGGEQQMLGISRALMSKPRLLLMDEPSIGLSPLMVNEIGSIIRGIHRQGISVLIVEQNAAIALRLADRGYVMETGKIVLGASRDELLSDGRVKKAYLGG
ncbi:MAG TPA: ABC transporter ATP-binding protein [Thermodesulfobacteriota bacterium]|nr:ABC transporter ATP-binding protein [Thermodesulfobacteriota bacterium]